MGFHREDQEAHSGVGGRGSEVLVDGFAADTELSGQHCFGFAGGGPLGQPVELVGVEGLLAAPVGTSLFGQSDAFSLPFAGLRRRRQLAVAKLRAGLAASPWRLRDPHSSWYGWPPSRTEP